MPPVGFRALQCSAQRVVEGPAVEHGIAVETVLRLAVGDAERSLAHDARVNAAAKFGFVASRTHVDFIAWPFAGIQRAGIHEWPQPIKSIFVLARGAAVDGALGRVLIEVNGVDRAIDGQQTTLGSQPEIGGRGDGDREVRLGIGRFVEHV
jgi:hypothetical protein